MKTLVSIKLDSKIKKEAQKAAEDLGLTLSAVVNAQLHEFARIKELHVGGALRPTPYLERILLEAENDLATGKVHGPFKSIGAFKKYLNK